MSITLGDKRLATHKPDDLDAALLSTTGCNAAENLRILSGSPLPGRVAAAIAPFLADGAPSVPELAALIEADMRSSTSMIVADVQRLFRSATAAEAGASEEKEVQNGDQA